MRNQDLQQKAIADTIAEMGWDYRTTPEHERTHHPAYNKATKTVAAKLKVLQAIYDKLERQRLTREAKQALGLTTTAGRPKTSPTTILAIRAPDGLVEWLTSQAQSKGITRHALMLQLLEQAAIANTDG